MYLTLIVLATALEDYAYFSGDSFVENELSELPTVVTDSLEELKVYVFYCFKWLMELQAGFMH